MTGDGDPTTVRRVGKSESAFRTISEVADDLDVPQHVLRFWESKFPQVKPLKRGGGRRYYRPEDVALLRRIRDLLYSEGYTIKGVQKLLREGGHKESATRAEPELQLPCPLRPGQAARPKARPKTISLSWTMARKRGGRPGTMPFRRRRSRSPAFQPEPWELELLLRRVTDAKFTASAEREVVSHQRQCFFRRSGSPAKPLVWHMFRVSLTRSERSAAR